MLQIFSPLLCQLILSQTILSSSPSTSSWSRPQNELLSPTNALEASTVSERRQNALLKAGNGYNHTSPNCQSQEDSAKGGHVLCRVCVSGSPPTHPQSFHHPLPGYLPVPGFSPCQHTQGFVLLWEATNFKVNYD